MTNYTGKTNYQMNKRRHNSRLFRKPVNLFKIENGIFYCGKPSNG